MGAKLEFNMVFSSIVDSRFLIEKCLNFQPYNILRIDVIDSWKWDNHNSISSLNEVPSLLSNGKTVIINGVSNNCNAGISIQPINNEFIYSFWIDISHDFTLELQMKTSPPEWIMIACGEIIKQFTTSCKAIAIGIESYIHYCININDLINNSNNVQIWILNKNFFGIDKSFTLKTTKQHQPTVVFL